MEFVLRKYDKFEVTDGTLYCFNYEELGLKEVNNGDTIIINDNNVVKKYEIEAHEYFMKSFGLRGDNVLVKLKEI